MSDTKNPVGTRKWRVTRAIHDHYTTTKSDEEIADELGVGAETVRRYIREPPSEEVETQLADTQREVRLVATEELKRQLREAGSESRTAEKVTKVWSDDDGHVHVRDIRDDTGELVSKEPVPHDIRMGDDSEARYFRRAEVREILEQLVDLVGAGEPDEHRIEHSGEMSGEFAVNITHNRVGEEDVSLDTGTGVGTDEETTE